MASRRSNDRRRQAEIARRSADTQERPGDNKSPIYTRREALIPLALLLAGGGIFGTYRHSRNQHERRMHMRSLPINFDEVVNRLRAKGEIVFDEENGRPERLFVLLKQFHGNDTFASLMARYPDLLQKYMDHQDCFTDTVKGEMMRHEPGLVNALVEGPDLAGRQSTWRSDTRESLRYLGGDPRIAQSVRDDVPSQLNKGGMIAYNAMSSCMAAVNLAAFSVANPEYANSVHGTDPRNFRGVAHEMYNRIEIMAKNENLTDEEIERFIAWFNDGKKLDMKRRNEYAASETLELTPKYGITFVILGGGHMAAGVNSKISGVCNHPLEEMLCKEKGTRTVVLDQQHFEHLMNYRGEDEPEMRIIGENNMNVEIIRELVRRKRKEIMQKSN